MEMHDCFMKNKSHYLIFYFVYYRFWELHILEVVDDRCLVHYVGWASKYDEWRKLSEVIEIKGAKSDAYQLLVNTLVK